MCDQKLVLNESCPKDIREQQIDIQVSKRLGDSPLTRFLVRVALVLFAGLVSASAHADITCNSLTALGQTLVAGSISVPANTPVGTVVSTLAPIDYTMQCKFANSGSNPNETSATNTANFTTTTPLVLGTDVYQTNVTGIGVRYIFNSSACNAANVTIANGAAAVTCPFSGPVGGAYVPAPMTVTVQLVVTGPISGGISNLTTAAVVGLAFVSSDNPKSWPAPNLYTGTATGTLTQATCSVQPTPPVSLPNIGTGALASVGTTAGARAFSLSLSCTSGAKVYITLTDSVNQANRSNTLQLTADSTAKGVGVQVLNGSSPVSFGADSAVVGNTNQWLIGSSPNGTLQVPLTARYISTGTVSAGSVKALATFTMAYQ